MGLYEKINGGLRLDTKGLRNVNSTMPEKKTPEEIARRKRKYYQANKYKIQKYAKKTYYQNRDAVLKRRAERKLNDPEHAEKIRAYHAAYYLKKKAERRAARAAAKREEQS